MTDHETRAHTLAARMLRKLAAVQELLAGLPDTVEIRELRERQRIASELCADATPETLQDLAVRGLLDILHAEAEAARRRFGLESIPPTSASLHTPIAWVAGEAAYPKKPA